MAAGKRWLAVAIPTGVSWRLRVERLGEVDTLLQRLRREAAGVPVLLGVDAPIGLPDAYVARHLGGRSGFRAFLTGLGADDPFFAVCDTIEQVSGARPFFPRTTAGSPRRAAQAARLGVQHHDDLLRSCDCRTQDRNRAACLFWTLGPNQVGKAALSLWRELLLPGLQAADPPALWPFDGDLPALLGTHAVTVAETYPAEALSGLRPRWRGSKRRQADRAGLAGDIRGWLDRLGAVAEPALAAELDDGFGQDATGEDRFDALLGALCLLAVLREPGRGAAPPEAARWEGWILGQRA